MTILKNEKMDNFIQETREDLLIYFRNVALVSVFACLSLCMTATDALADTTLYSHIGSGGECCEVKGATGDSEAWSQTFTIANDYDLTTADLWASSQGGGDGLVIKIYADSGGLPTGSALFTSSSSGIFSGGSLNDDTVSFTSACLLAGTYDFTIERTGARDATNDWVVGHTAGSGIGTSDNGTWSSAGSYYLKSAIFGTQNYDSCGGGGGGESTPDNGIATTTLAYWCITTGSRQNCYQNATSTALRTQDAGNLTFALGIIIFFINIFFMGALWTGLTKKL